MAKWKWLNDLKVKASKKTKEVKSKAKSFVNEVKDWSQDNREIIIPLIPVVVSGVFEVFKVYLRTKDRNAARESRIEERKYFYDPSSRRWIRCTRVLDNDDLLRLEKLRGEGYKTIEALNIMGLLA